MLAQGICVCRRDISTLLELTDILICEIPFCTICHWLPGLDGPSTGACTNMVGSRVGDTGLLTTDIMLGTLLTGEVGQFTMDGCWSALMGEELGLLLGLGGISKVGVVMVVGWMGSGDVSQFFGVNMSYVEVTFMLAFLFRSDTGFGEVRGFCGWPIEKYSLIRNG